MTRDERDRLRAMAKAAVSPLPWRWGQGRSNVLLDDGILAADGESVFVNCGRCSGEPEDSDKDYLIAAANSVPSLLDRLDAAEGLLREWPELLLKWRDKLPVGQWVPGSCAIDLRTRDFLEGK